MHTDHSVACPHAIDRAGRRAEECLGVVEISGRVGNKPTALRQNLGAVVRRPGPAARRRGMAGPRVAALRSFRDLFHSGPVSGLDDGQLLERFATRHDEAAFAALVALHGPMVLGVCRRMLRDGHDVEDGLRPGACRSRRPYRPCSRSPPHWSPGSGTPPGFSTTPAGRFFLLRHGVAG